MAFIAEKADQVALYLVNGLLVLQIPGFMVLIAGSEVVQGLLVYHMRLIIGQIAEEVGVAEVVDVVAAALEHHVDLLVSKLMHALDDAT